MLDYQNLMEQTVSKKKGLVERWSGITNTLPETKSSNADSWNKAQFAQILENQLSHLSSLDEDTRTNAIGNFEKFIFPMIRAVWPTLASQELVSVQAMDGPVSMLFYLDFVAGSAKGAVTKGMPLITARTGMREEAQNYQSETIDAESVTLAGGNLTYVPVRPGSVSVSYINAATAYTAYDDGNGVLTGTSFTGTINYVSGAYTITSVGSTALVATYEYNSEAPDFANNPIPQMDAQLTSGPVVSRPDKLRARWSVEVAAQLKAVHGLDAEVELTEALAQQVRFGIDNKIINSLYRIAQAGNVTFDAAPPTGVPYFTHQMAISKTLQSGSNMIFKGTRRGFGNWIVAGVDAATIIENHPQFESSGNLNGPGIVFAGTLMGKWKVWKNPFLNNIGGSGFASNSFLIGYKGNNFYDAGFVYAPYIPFYQTPTVVLDDMMFRKAVMTHYGIKAVNGLFYATGSILNY
jgi:hypothetical protein